MTPTTEDGARILRELVEREIGWRRIFVEKDLPYLISLMSFVDSRTGETISLEHIREPLQEGEVWLEGNALRCKGWDGPSIHNGGEKTWRWQRYLVDRRIAEKRTIDLKGRQIGDTWIYLALDVAEAITMPGADSLLYRQREDEAIDNAQRWWTLFQSLPAWVLERVPVGNKFAQVKVSKPKFGDRPGRDGISLKFTPSIFSDVIPMSSAASSGHGRSTRRIGLDEAAHIDELLAIRAAVEPAAGNAHIDIISTANGTSDPETGEGNEFHRVWSDEYSGYHRLFLGYYLHPERDQEWYDTSPEVLSLPMWKRQEQFPRNEVEAFALSNRVFFDPESLEFYAAHIEEPKYRFNFLVENFIRAKAVKSREGRMRLFREPRSDHTYAIGADIASGRGRDYSAAYVIDLQTMEWCVEYHAKVAEDVFAQDLHFLGKMYNNALIAPETQGGHGQAVIVALRDGAKGRPAYTKLYRHRNEARRDRPDTEAYGMPMSPATRPLIVNQIEMHVRERTLPFVTSGLITEMQVFVEHKTGPSPRAREGMRDDRVMAAGITLDLFRRYGLTIKRASKRAQRARAQRARVGAVDPNRYRKAERS